MARECRSTPQAARPGWNAPALAPWLEPSLARASQAAFGAPRRLYGRGRLHPVHGHAGREVPARRSSSITGVLGPHSNAHGPNEFLHIPTGKRISMVVAQVLADQHASGLT